MKADDIIKQARDRLSEINRELSTLVEEKAKLERIVGAADGPGVTIPAVDPNWIRPPVMPGINWPPPAPLPYVPWAPAMNPWEITCTGTGTLKLDTSGLRLHNGLDDIVLGGPQRPVIHVGSS